MTRTLHFQFKGQMINYFNKVKNNPKVKSCFCFLSAKDGYTVMYTI